MKVWKGDGSSEDEVFLRAYNPEQDQKEYYSMVLSNEPTYMRQHELNMNHAEHVDPVQPTFRWSDLLEPGDEVL